MPESGLISRRERSRIDRSLDGDVGAMYKGFPVDPSARRSPSHELHAEKSLCEDGCARSPLLGYDWSVAKLRDTLKELRTLCKLDDTEARFPSYSPRQGDESDELLS